MTRPRRHARRDRRRGRCLRAGGLVAMPTETVYGLAADATSDAAVAGDLRRQGTAGDQPAHRPCSRPRRGARACRLRSGGRTAGARLLAGAADPRPARGVDLPDQPARARRSRHRRAARAGARDGPRADRRGGRPARRPFRQPIGPGQPDHRRPCGRRSRRPGRLRSSTAAPAAMAWNRRSSRLSRRPASIAAPRSHPRARRSNPRSVRRSSRPAGRERRRTRRGSWPRTMRPTPIFASVPLRLARMRPRSISAACSGGARQDARLDLSPAGDLVEAASHLFAYLRALDAGGAARIAVAPIPEHGLGAAINDRLRRAAAPRTDQDRGSILSFSGRGE